MKKTWYRYRNVLIGLILSGSMCAVADTGDSVSLLSFTAKCNGTGVSDDGATWTITSDGRETSFDNTKGIQYTNKSGDKISFLQLSSNEIAGTIREVTVTACASNAAQITVRVGGVDFLFNKLNYSNMTTSPYAYRFTGEGTGEVQVLISQPSSTNSIYCKSIEVTHQASRTVTAGNEWRVDAASSVEELVIEKEGTVVLANKNLTIKGDLVIRADRETGTSGQLCGAQTGLLALEGDAYMEITLGADADPNKWHGLAVPFPVSAQEGLFSPEGRQLVYGEDYAIMTYDGAARADGLYGWTKEQGTLMPGVFYMVTVDGREPVLKLKKLRESAPVTAAEKGYRHYTGVGSSADAGWNGMGNPTIAYRTVDVPIQVFDESAYAFVTVNAGETPMAVGTPFFYQAPSDGTLLFTEQTPSKPGAAARSAHEQNSDAGTYRKIALSNGTYTDWLYVAPDKDAAETYQAGRDLVKMRITDTPAVPQITALAKGERLTMLHLPLATRQTTCALMLYAPQKGEYTLTLTPEQRTGDYDRDNSSALWALLKDGMPLTPNAEGQWTLQLEKGENTGFSLLITLPGEKTGLENPEINNTDADGSKDPVTNRIWRKRIKDGYVRIESDQAAYGINGEPIR